MQILHIVDRTGWADAVRAGEYRPASVDREGFVHFSFADQVTGVADALYRDEPDLIVVELDSDDLPYELRVEDSYGSGTEFPHVYGPIATTVPYVVHALKRTAQGDARFDPQVSPGDATGSASTGH